MQLKTNPDNPRTISKDRYEKLKRSIERNPDGLTANKIAYKDGIIISGNQRYRALLELGLEMKPEYFKNLTGWTQEQIDEWIIQSNISAGEWDWDKLANEWDAEALEEWGVDVDKTWTTKELPDNIDETPEPPKKPISKLGDVWLLGKHRVMCGDSTDKATVEKLMDGKKADMVFTDPPYGIAIVQSSADGGSKGFGSVGGRKIVKTTDYSPVIGDDSVDTAVKAYKVCRDLQIEKLIFWGGNYYASHLPDSSCWYVWDKNNTGNFADCELAWTNMKRSAKLYKQTWNGMIREGESDKRVHPTQKPIALATNAFEVFEAGQIILDLFLGSGSTLIACEQTDRICYGLELDPQYVDVICKRYQQLTGIMPILEETGEPHDFTK